VAHSHHDDHENGLIDDAPRRGELGAVAPRTMALFALGFVLGAVAIASMGIAITPHDPPPIRPVELGSPDNRERGGDGADRRRDRGELRRGPEARERDRPRSDAVPAPPHARQQQPPAQAVPPAAAPRPRTRVPAPAPGPRQKPRSAVPAPPAQQPAPPPPAADEDAGDDDAGGDGDED
jgi:hypothetical protein